MLKIQGPYTYEVVDNLYKILDDIGNEPLYIENEDGIYSITCKEDRNGVYYTVKNITSNNDIEGELIGENIKINEVLEILSRK